jgi:ketosteroid isomerase-like protein
MRSGTTRYRAFRRREVKVRTYGCVAVITGTAEVEITSRGQDQTLQLRFLSAWVKRPSGIQFVSWNSTRLAPPPPQ